MKTSTFFLAGSLVANAAFVAVFLAGSSARHASSTAAPVIAPATPAKPVASNDPAAGVDPEMWAHLQTDELPAMLERMRAEGFPNSVIRAIMAEQVRLQFAPRRHALTDSAKAPPYWSPATQDPKIAAQLREIMKEQDRATKDLLGPDPEDSFATTLRRHFPNWSDDKIAALQRIQTEFGEKRNEIAAAARDTRGTISPDEMNKINALQNEAHAAMAQLLSPQELEDYDLRLGNTANNLRAQLAGFDPSEQEFRALHALQQAFNDRFGPMYGPFSADDIRARGEAQRQLNDQIHAALGDQRYADYQRTTDYNYQVASRLVARLELPPETANQLYTMQKDFQERMTQAMRIPGDHQERSAQLGTMADEAETTLTTLLGPRGLEAYKQNGGQWVQSIRQMQASLARMPAAPPPRGN
ncbi:MAG TPA: hypothetical protein VHD62_16365 [Opitutaceae bacterium]|nr:hypothetical protein [Opitutaceae bacterium]